MDYLYLRYGMEICLKSKSTEKYLGFDQVLEIVNADSVPPYIQISRLDNKVQNKKLRSLKFKIQPKDESDRGKVISFGSKAIFIDCQTGSYLTTMSAKSQIGFDKPGLDEGMNNMLEKSATFTLMDEKNIRSKQSISVYDQVHLKSVYGRFLFCSKSRKVDNSGESQKTETAWNLMKGDTPYIPAWVYQRPTFSKYLNLGQIQVDPVFGRDKKQNLGSLPANIQQMKLVEDLLDIMLGFDGEYIKKNSNNQYIIQPQKQRPTCSLALAQLTSKILALPTTVFFIQNYISTYSIQQGIVCQALCSGLRQILKQYKMMIVSLDKQVNDKGLTLQQFWYYIQPSLQMMENIVILVKQAQKLKGGQLISIIMKMLNGTIPQNVFKMYSYLFDSCMNMYIQMISKWIYEGIVEDKYKQFMIMEDQKDKENDWNYWQEKYTLRRDQVPTIFAKDAHIILVTGKYLNIIKNCSQLETHPLQKQIQKNIQKYIKYQDFTESIMRAYDWANQKLQNLVLKQYKLIEVLGSMKGYYFLQFGDLFVHFMDSAEQQLNSKSGKFKIDIKTKPVSVQKLQNLFELLIRTSSANNDPYKQQITCKLETSSIYQQIHKIKILQPQIFQYDVSEKPLLKKQSKYADYFNLQYNCVFPLNLIINKKNLSKYQVIFRFMFWCKFVERQLNSTWLTLQATKIVTILSFKKATLVTQKMLNYIKNLIYYLSYEVIEHNWIIFKENLKKVKNFEDIIQYHNNFLNKCLAQTLLINNKLLQIITIDLGNSTQGFLKIKDYVTMFNPQKIPIIPNPKESILTQMRSRTKQIQKSFQKWHEQNEFEQFIFSFSDNFDKSMKKLLREIHSMVGKQENHLLCLLNKLDEKRFYGKMLFDHKYE